ncbi:hypothetical protein BRAO375_1530020 [Bradyrhizobium sp. ORS 375]|nr:hypothetical protein BRAO375_1530020 [Bradyrhizobium sp. ORS 375]
MKSLSKQNVLNPDYRVHNYFRSLLTHSGKYKYFREIIYLLDHFSRAPLRKIKAQQIKLGYQPTINFRDGNLMATLHSLHY